MSASSPVCTSCSGALPDNAIFCPTCGTRTPTGIRSATGEAEFAPSATDRESEERRRALQAAIGDSCEVRELLGRGGFAEVFVGWDRRLKRELAIKTLRGDVVASHSMLERFQREAEAVAKLRHPHIIPIYGVGEGEGIAYFTMPRIEGESLSTALERDGAMPVPEATRILREAAGALDAAHRAGLVHRDIKPENIMLEGPERRALVMDFGIAKSVESGERGLTGTGMLVGTPHYMSPEQAAGDRNIDHRTDQYSLAVVGYRMLSGRLPFDADSVQTLLVKQVTTAPIPLAECAPNVSPEVSRVIERALAKRPEDRFASMAEFSAALAAATERGAPASTVRRFADLQERIATMRRFLPGLRHPLVWAALLSVVAFGVLLPRSHSPVGYESAANRDEALFTVRSYLTSQGIGSPAAIQSGLQHQRNQYRFLLDNVGGDSTAALARAGLPIWHWHFIVRVTGQPHQYHVDVSPGNRVTRVEQRLRDTTTLPAVEPQVAESLAVAAVAARWDMSLLERLADSVVNRRNRVDRHFTWKRADLAIPGARGDTAFGSVRVRVSGDRVTDYSEYLEVPPAEARRVSRWLVAAAVIAWITGILLVLSSIMVAILRQRDDTLQWGLALKVALTSIALLTVTWVADLQVNLRVGAPGASGDLLLNAVLTGGLAAVAVLLCGVFGFASGESLAAESRPHAVAGVAELGRGRGRTPEMAYSAIWGIIFGAIALAVDALSMSLWAGYLGGPSDPSVSGIFAWNIPAPRIAAYAALAIVLTTGIMYTQMVLLRWTRSAPVAILVPALIAGGLLVGAGDVPEAVKTTMLLVTLVVSVATWRFGLIAGTIAFFIAMAAPDVVALGMWQGISGGFIVAAAMLLAPVVLGFMSLRRYRS